MLPVHRVQTAGHQWRTLTRGAYLFLAPNEAYALASYAPVWPHLIRKPAIIWVTGGFTPVQIRSFLRRLERMFPSLVHPDSQGYVTGSLLTPFALAPQGTGYRMLPGILAPDQRAEYRRFFS